MVIFAPLYHLLFDWLWPHPIVCARFSYLPGEIKIRRSWAAEPVFYSKTAHPQRQIHTLGFYFGLLLAAPHVLVPRSITHCLAKR